jgi:SAM-dependent methyltransferase
MASLFGIGRKSAAEPARTALPDWAAPLFAAALQPALKDGEEVLVWALPDDASTAVVSGQFTDHAADYHRRYAASDHFERLFRRALEDAGAGLPERPLVLDLGSGSGVNSVVPLRRIFPGARCVATDLSAELLAILAAYLRETGGGSEAVCVRMDAMRPHVAEGAFDLVAGAAILHHLERPEDGLAAAARALRPGGLAVFFEPFEGWALVRLAFERILAEAPLRREALAPPLERALRGMVADIAARTDPDPASPGFRDLDDKWLFSRGRMAEMAAAAGFAEPRILPNNVRPDLFRKVPPIHLRLAAGDPELAIPDWAMEILAGFDAAAPESLKRAAPLEAAVMLRKRG